MFCTAEQQLSTTPSGYSRKVNVTCNSQLFEITEKTGCHGVSLSNYLVILVRRRLSFTTMRCRNQIAILKWQCRTNQSAAILNMQLITKLTSKLTMIISEDIAVAYQIPKPLFTIKSKRADEHHFNFVQYCLIRRFQSKPVDNRYGLMWFVNGL